MDHSSSQRLTIENENEETLDLWIEPWGDRLKMPPLAEFEIFSEATAPGAFHLTVRRGAVSIHVWRECTSITVRHEGEEIDTYKV